jgi:hypothetical protein
MIVTPVTKLVRICCKKSELHDDSLRQFKNRLRPDKEIDSEPFSLFKPTKHDHAQGQADNPA